MLFIETLFLLLAGHALADFVLQPEAMGRGKNRNNIIHSDTQSLFPHWSYWMTGHAMIHGGIVFLVTDNVVLGLVEVLTHWAVDFLKCERFLSLHQDQAIHIALKVVYAGYVFQSFQ